MFNIFKVDALLFIRDRSNMFLMLIFPVLLVFLLGNLLENMDNVDSAIEPMDVKYVMETTDPYYKTSIEVFLDEIKENDTISLTEISDRKKAADSLNSGDISAIVVFTDPMGVILYEGLDNVQNKAMSTILNSFAVQTSSIKTLYDEAPEMMTDVDSVLESKSVNENKADFSRSMLDYYAVTMLVMMLFMGGAIGGASKIFEERRDGTLSRLLASPKNKSNLYLQTALGGLPQTFIQAMVIMIFSVFFLGAQYASSINGNAVLLATFVLVGTALSSLFTMIGIFIKNNPTMVIMPVLWGVMFISGTFSKEVYIEGITELSPIWVIQNAAFDLTVFGNYGKCLSVMVVSVIIIIVSTALGTVLYNRKALVS